MNSDFFIPFGILGFAGLIILLSIAIVVRHVVKRSHRAKDDLRAAFPMLFKKGFVLETGLAATFAPTVARWIPDRGNLRLHFRIPGRGYTGSLAYDGVECWMIQFIGFAGPEAKWIRSRLQLSAGRILYDRPGRLQWQPSDGTRETILPLLDEILSNVD